jgi:peptide/nickel transport system permease protein
VTRYVLRRLGSAVITLVIVMFLVFFIFQVLGDPARRILPLNATEADVQEYRQATGLADPLLERLWRYVEGVGHLDFGISTTRGEPAMSVVLDALPRTLWLALAAFVITAAVGVTLGVIAGLRVGRPLDRFVQGLSSVLASTPDFWTGLILVLVFAVNLRLFPTSGFGGIDFVILPALALAVPPIGRITAIVRESVRAVSVEPYVLVARSKGLANRTLVFGHIVRAGLVPIVSIGGLELSRMAIGGVVVIESVFAWPGLGRLYIDAMKRYDLALVSATLFVATLTVLLINIALDVAYAAVDPRVRLVNAHQE